MLKRKWKYLLLVFIFSFVAFIFGTDYWVSNASEDYTFSSTEDIPYSKVGLLLGTSKYLKKGGVNPYYRYRIEAAVALYKAGKIDYILVSGDNRKENYNEPQTMKNDLIEYGIPSERIVMDYAGFRTLDSILRSHKVFGQNRITIISQPFHNERAIFIAHQKGIAAFGFNAKDVDGAYGFKVMMREKLARVKMLLDLLLNTQPKFYGPEIAVG